MWRIFPPQIDDALKDIDDFVSNGDLPAEEKQGMVDMTQKYHWNHGSIDIKDIGISDDSAQKLYNLYDNETIFSKKKCGRYYKIREDLQNDVYVCPLCGMEQHCTLDHQLPRNPYKALSMSRMNLVPACFSCNHAKLDKPFTDFIHPYYFDPPKDKIFLIAHIKLTGDSIFASMDVDDSVFPLAEDTAERIRRHLRGIDLDSRMKDAYRLFLQHELIDISRTENELLTELPMIIAKTEKEFGLNHWKSALVRSILEVHYKGELSHLISVLNYMKETSRSLRT